MDESFEYVEMCKMATEIQNEYGGTPNSFYVSIDSDPDGIHKETIYFGTINTLPKGSVYWIPRQDELQNMLRTKNLRDLLFYNHKIFQEYMSQIEGYDPETMEQAWLMLVMKEKYGKVWSGEDWYNPYEVGNKELWGCKYGDEWSCPCDDCMHEPLSESCEKFRKEDGNELVYINTEIKE